jgi:alpha-tubulin suppressor-like RCC1 family protein
VVAAGGNVGSDMALGRDGTVWTWGANFLGQLGDGTTAPRVAPAPVPGLSEVKALVGGNHHRLALRQDGTVWAWGGNTFGQLGDPALDFFSPSPSPTQVPGLTDVVAIQAPFSHSMAVRADGTVWTWGGEPFAWGGGWDDIRTSPAPVPGLSEVTAVAGGLRHYLALRADGTVWTWRNLLYGVPPQDVASSPYRPLPVEGLTDVVAIAAGVEFSLALRADGTVWTWGVNTYGQLGYPTSSTVTSTPAPVPGLTGVVALTAGSSSAAALRADGTVWTWGLNDTSQLGNGVISLSVPTQGQLPCRFTALPALEHRAGEPRSCQDAP